MAIEFKRDWRSLIFPNEGNKRDSTVRSYANETLNKIQKYHLKVLSIP